MKTKIHFLRNALLLFCFLLSKLAFSHGGDTLRCNFVNSPAWVYKDSLGGFLFGTNSQKDMEFAQKYGVSTTVTNCSAEDSSFINNVFVWFGAKKTNLGNGSVRVKIYSVNSLTGAPDSLLSTSFSKTINHLIDTSSISETYTEFLLQTVVTLTDSFFVSVEFFDTSSDTIGIASTKQGSGTGRKLSWVKSKNGSWTSVEQSKNMDVDLAIFPVVKDVDSGIEEDFPDIKMFVSPTPANEEISFNFISEKYYLFAELKVYNVNGCVERKFLLTDIFTGENNFRLITNNLNDGIYFYNLQIDHKKIYGKILILKK